MNLSYEQRLRREAYRVAAEERYGARVRSTVAVCEDADLRGATIQIIAHMDRDEMERCLEEAAQRLGIETP